MPMKPRLVYDGDCAFCRYAVEYAASVTADAVDYRSYQEVMAEYPDITEAEFADSIQLFADGERRERANAAFRTLAIGGVRFWDRLYRRLPGFAALSDALYRWVARHRGLCLKLARPLFGRQLRRAEFNVTADLVIRGIALCGLIAYLSLWWQLEGLIGPQGSAPRNRLFRCARQRLRRRTFLVPADGLLARCLSRGPARGMRGRDARDADGAARTLALHRFADRLRLLSVASRRRPGLPVLSVGHLPHRMLRHRRRAGPRTRLRGVAGAAGAVPFHVPVGLRQARERRSHLGRRLRPRLPLRNPAPAKRARVVCPPSAADRSSSGRCG